MSIFLNLKKWLCFLVEVFEEYQESFLVNCDFKSLSCVFVFSRYVQLMLLQEGDTGCCQGLWPKQTHVLQLLIERKRCISSVKVCQGNWERVSLWHQEVFPFRFAPISLPVWGLGDDNFCICLSSFFFSFFFFFFPPKLLAICFLFNDYKFPWEIYLVFRAFLLELLMSFCTCNNDHVLSLRWNIVSIIQFLKLAFSKLKLFWIFMK